ncbi:unnamed protein product, partial [Meganyctiphanes norvegica]
GYPISNDCSKSLETPDTADKLKKGDWGGDCYCPKKYFAKAVELKFDNQILKGIKLHCANEDGYDNEPISSTVVSLGKWNDRETCKHGYMTAVHVRSQSANGLTGLPIYCGGSTEEKSSIGNGYGLGDYLQYNPQNCSN